MKYMRIHVSAYFLTGSLNWQVFWGKEKYYLLNSSYEKVKNKVSLKQM